MSPMPADVPPAPSVTAFGMPTLGSAGSAPTTTTRRARTYTVRPGDTVYDIAARHDTTVATLVRANGLSDGGRWIRPGQQLRLSAGSGGGTAATPSHAPAAGRTVTVRPGDTLSGIAAKHGVSVTALASSNGITNTRMIYPGQKLTISGSGHSSSGSATSSAPTRPGTASTASGTASSHSVRVRAGDTLYRIATSHGVSVDALIEANPGIRPRALGVGTTVRMPGGSSSRPMDEPYTRDTIADRYSDREVEDTFGSYTYSSKVARSAAANRDYLASVPVPSSDRIRSMVVATARRHGVDPSLMLALAYQESGWNQRAVSPANAIGVMQVIPSSGQWASGLVGRDLNLLDPQDNVTAGVVIMRALQRSADDEEQAVGGYYQGLGSVQRQGLFSDTRAYVKSITALRSRL